MATTVTVYPPPGTTYPDAAGVPITSTGAIVDNSKYIRDAIRDGYLLTYDPLGVYQPDDRTDTGGGGGGSANSFAYASLLGAFVGSEGAVAFTDGALSRGDGGGGQWYWDSSDTVSVADNATVCGASEGGRWKRVNTDVVDVRWFGARGDNNQTLQSVTPYSGFPWTISQQTADAIAINKAIRYVKQRGGGTIYIPRGTYRVYGYLEVLDHTNNGDGTYSFADITIAGDGPGQTVLKNCDSSPVNTHGYGIFQIGVANGIVTSNSRVTKVGLRDLTLDGNAVTRNITSGEWWSDNLVAIGWPALTMERVESVNAVRDCVLLNFEGFNSGATQPSLQTGVEQSAKLSQCTFDKSWRNTLTIASGANIQVSDSSISGGGRVGTGTLPRCCMDIEPDGADYVVRDILFSNCIFRDAPGQLISVVWSQVRFTGCTFKCEPPFDTLHWPLIAVSSQVDFIGCSFVDLIDRNAYLWYYPGYGTGVFAATEYMNVRGCTFDGCGFLGQGYHTTIEGCEFSNSKFPVLFLETTEPVKDITVRNCNLVNVVDIANAGSGPMASFAIHESITCSVLVDGVTSRFDPGRLPAGLDLTTDNGSGLVVAHGVCIDPSPAADAEVKIMNVHSSGWYRKYTTAFGIPPSGFRSDWGGGGGGDLGPAPADSSGTQATPGSIYYKGCSYYGDLA